MLILYQRMFTVNFDKILKPMLADIRFFFCHHHHHHHHQSYKYTLLFSLTFDFFKRIIEHFNPFQKNNCNVYHIMYYIKW